MKTLRIFISSPSDVRAERVRAYDVVRRLQTKFRAFIKLEPILWEHEPMRGTATFQAQIIPPSKTDIVICILWTRIGMRLPQDFKRPDGTIPTGTEWEFEDAYAAHLAKGIPDLLVYRKTGKPVITFEGDEALKEWIEQKKTLDGFLERWFKEHGVFKAAFTSFTDDSEFETKLGTHLEKIINERIPSLELVDDAERPRITWFEGSPFRGLSAFEKEHEAVFFGRDLAIREITERLLAQASVGRVFLMILGMSGCGKSSLARAGVLPELLRPGVVGAVSCWRWLVLRPGECPGTLLDGLAAALLGDATALPELAALGYDTAKFSALMRDAPVHAIPLIQSALEQGARKFCQDNLRTTPAQARCLLIIDQLEEIFTIERFSNAQRLAFVHALATLANSGLVWVVTTMRTDLYARCAEVEELLTLRGADGQYDLSPPGFSELGQMIRAPARAAGLHFETHPVSGQKLADALHEEASKNPKALPLLEFCLEELYQHKTPANVITWDTYTKLGGLVGAIAKRAEETYAGLSPAGQESLAGVFSALIVVGDTATAQPCLRASLVRHPGAEEVVTAFTRANLFITDIDQAGSTVVALAHEALITGWPRVQNWLRDNQDFLRVKARLGAAAHRWLESRRHQDYLLLEGKPLAEAREALKNGRAQLAELEVEFVQASSTRATQQRRRRRLLTAAVLAVMLALIAGAMVIKIQDVQNAASNARHAASEADYALAADEITGGNMPVALAYLADALRKNPANAKATALTISILSRCPFPVLSLHDADEVQWASFSPDGKLVVTASADGTARIWNARTGAEIVKLPHGGWVHYACFNEDGTRVVTASYDHTAKIWDAQTGQEIGQPLRHDDAVYTANFSPDGRKIVTASKDGTAKIWDAQTGQEIGQPMQHDNIVWTAVFSPDSTRVLTASADHTARVWDAQTGKAIQILGQAEAQEPKDEVNCAEYSPNGLWIATASDDGHAVIWDARTGKSVHNIDHHGFAVNALNFSQDSKWLVTTSSDKTARVWNVQTGEQVGAPMQDAAWVRYANFSQDGRFLVTASYDGTARIWETQTGKPLSEPMYHAGAVYAANFSPDGKQIVTASFDNTARIWNVPAVAPARLMNHSGDVDSANFSPNGHWVVTASEDGTAKIWDARTGAAETHGGSPVILAPKGGAKVNTADFSPDGKWVVTGSEDGDVQLWDAQTGDAIRNPQTQQPLARQEANEVDTVNFSPDGKMVVAACADGMAHIWNLQTDLEVTTAKNNLAATSNSPIAKITAACFNPAGTLVATASADWTARIWDAHTGKEIGATMWHDGIVNDVEFSPDGKLLVTASADHRARVWDAQTGKEIGKQMRHEGWVYTAHFSPDGRWVVTASGDGTARVWDALSGEPVSEPMRHLNAVHTANFSPDGRWVVTASWDGTARIWDAQSGQAVSEPMVPEKASRDAQSVKVNTASFSPDGKSVVTAASNMSAEIWPAPITVKEAPEWLCDLAEDMGGARLDDKGLLEPAAQDAVHFREIFNQLPGIDELTQFAHWLIVDPDTRPISPAFQSTP